MSYIRNSIGAGLTALALGIGCGKAKSPIQPLSLIIPSQYETLDTRLQESNLTPEYKAFLQKPSLSQARRPQDIPVNPSITDIYTATKIATPESKILGVEDIGYDLGRFEVIIRSPGYLDRQTKVIADIKSQVIDVDADQVPVDPLVQTLFKEAAQTTRRWKQPPTIYVSRDEEFMKYADVHVTDEHIQRVLKFIKKLESSFGYYARDAKVIVVDKSPWEPVNPNQTTKYPVKAPKGSIIVEYDNTIPGTGAANFSDRDKDGFIDDGAVSFRTILTDSDAGTFLQELGTAFLFGYHPETLTRDQSVYTEGTSVRDFTPTDTKAAHWGYNRPSLNQPDDRDNGWELKWRKNEAGILIPCEERLLLNGVVYKPVLIPGDFDANNQVGFDDFFAFASAFNTSEGKYDLDFDGQVGFNDFFIFADNFGRVRSLPNVSAKPILDTRVARIREIVDDKKKMEALLDEASHDSKEEMKKFVKNFYN